jgi:hypothetical protein
LNSNFHQNIEKESEEILARLEEDTLETDEPTKDEMSMEVNKSMWTKFLQKDEKPESRMTTELPKPLQTFNKLRSSFKTPINSSIFQQPKLVAEHKESKNNIRDEPPMKKPKQIVDNDDDFIISQEDLNFIDSLH